jgi:hypothetical protein
MARRLADGLALALVLSGTAVAATSETARNAEPAPDAVVTTSPTPAPTPVSRVTRQLQNRQLQLPSYARYGADPFADIPKTPAFSEEVEVVAKPMDTQSLTLKMKWWMSDFEPWNGRSGGSRFQAPTLAEMREHRPTPPQAVNFQPVLGWLLGKITHKDDSDKH